MSLFPTIAWINLQSKKHYNKAVLSRVRMQEESATGCYGNPSKQAHKPAESRMVIKRTLPPPQVPATPSGANEFIFVYIFVASLFFVAAASRQRT